MDIKLFPKFDDRAKINIKVICKNGVVTNAGFLIALLPKYKEKPIHEIPTEIDLSGKNIYVENIYTILQLYTKNDTCMLYLNSLLNALMFFEITKGPIIDFILLLNSASLGGITLGSYLKYLRKTPDINQLTEQDINLLRKYDNIFSRLSKIMCDIYEYIVSRWEYTYFISYERDVGIKFNLDDINSYLMNKYKYMRAGYMDIINMIYEKLREIESMSVEKRKIYVDKLSQKGKRNLNSERAIINATTLQLRERWGITNTQQFDLQLED